MPARKKKIGQQREISKAEYLGRIHVQRRSEKNQAADVSAVLDVIQSQSSTHAFAQQIKLGGRALLLEEADHRRDVFRGLCWSAKITPAATGETVSPGVEAINIDSVRVQGIGDYVVGTAVITNSVEHEKNAVARNCRRPVTIEKARLIGRDDYAVPVGDRLGGAESIGRRIDCGRHLRRCSR